MPTRTIKTRGYPDFKITEPLNQPAELKKAHGEILKSDQLAEFSHMRLESVRSAIKHLTGSQAADVIARLDTATNDLGSVRQYLADAAYQLEEIMRKANIV
jgi:hypothetical protein